MAEHQLDEYGMVVINGVRYRPDEIPPGLVDEEPADEEPAKKAPAKKAAPAAANKAKVPAPDGGAGDSPEVATK